MPYSFWGSETCFQTGGRDIWFDLESPLIITSICPNVVFIFGIVTTTGPVVQGDRKNVTQGFAAKIGCKAPTLLFRGVSEPEFRAKDFKKHSRFPNTPALRDAFSKKMSVFVTVVNGGGRSHICHFFSTHTLLGSIFLHTDLEQNCINYDKIL